MQWTNQSPRLLGRLVGLWFIFACALAFEGTQHTQKGTPPQNPRQAAVSDSVATMQVMSPYVSFRTREWTLNDGLPAPLKTVAQTLDGYLWITTFAGPVRFDGVRFTRYTTDNTPAFRSHDLLGLYVTDGWYALDRRSRRMGLPTTRWNLDRVRPDGYPLAPLGAGVCRGCKWNPLDGEYRADRRSLRWDCLDARPTAHS